MSIANFAHRVLVVDASGESRDVLRALLERTGTETLESASSTAAVPLAARERPDLIVVDVDSDDSDEHRATRELSDQARRNDTPIVVLGKLKQREPAIEASEYLSKPYHYGDLLHKIEEVLQQRRAA